MQQFFRLDLNLDIYLDAAVDLANASRPTIVYEDFDEYVASRDGLQPAKQLALIFNEVNDPYSVELDTFQERLDHFMQLPVGDAQRDAFTLVCEHVANLLEIVIAGNLSDGECASFSPSVLNGLLVASFRARETMADDDIAQLWEQLREQIITLLRTNLLANFAANADIEGISRFVYFASSLFGFLRLTPWRGAGEFLHHVNDFLTIKDRIGNLWWRKLDNDSRFRFSIVALHCVSVLFEEGEPFSSRPGISTKSLQVLRHALCDACNIVRADGGSMYVPMMRYFIGKIDEGLTYSARLHRTEIDNFTEADQFEVQRLVERFRHYRYAVTEEHLVGFLSQFDTPKRMQLVIRLLREVKFYTLGNLQAMIEEAFVSLADCNQITTVVPLGNVGGSTALMSYLASHGALHNLKFEPDVESALENTKSDAPICFIDDGAFSGTQLINIFGDLLGTRVRKSYHTKYTKPLSEPNHLLKRPIRICLAIASDKANDVLPKKFKEMGIEDFVVSACEIEVFRQRPFGASMSRIWDTPAEQSEIKQLFSEVGEALLEDRATEKSWPEDRARKSALGFGGDQRLIVYQYNVPKSTLTALWQRGKYKGRDWKPLFPADD